LISRTPRWQEGGKPTDPVKLYEHIEFSEVYHSATQAPHKPVQAVIPDQQELQKLLPDIPLPSVDFAGKQLIVVALDEKAMSGSDVRITSVMYLTDRLQGRPPLCPSLSFSL